MKTNAKQEFLAFIRTEEKLKALKCAIIEVNGISAVLKINYSLSDLDNLIELLNVNYDSGYGGQELLGTIWFSDGSWASRGEYDGSEWWELNSYPEIPENLK